MLILEKNVFQKLCRDPLALFGLFVILILFITVVLSPYLAPHDPIAVNVDYRLQKPNRQYWLGTDNLGRCIFSRLIFGARISLFMSLLTFSLIMSIGLILGAMAGYLGGWPDALIMGIIDIILAFPNLVLAIVVAGILGPGLFNVMAAMAAVWWVKYARVIRGMALSIKEKEFIEAQRAIGSGSWRIISRHIVPNILGPLIVLATSDMGEILLAISALGFLGLGAQPPTAEWGAMLNEARPYLQLAPHLMIFPGLAIMLTVLAFNVLGDGLRDVLDTRI